MNTNLNKTAQEFAEDETASTNNVGISSMLEAVIRNANELAEQIRDNTQKIQNLSKRSMVKAYQLGGILEIVKATSRSVPFKELFSTGGKPFEFGGSRQLDKTEGPIHWTFQFSYMSGVNYMRLYRAIGQKLGEKKRELDQAIRDEDELAALRVMGEVCTAETLRQAYIEFDVIKPNAQDEREIENSYRISCRGDVEQGERSTKRDATLAKFGGTHGALIRHCMGYIAKIKQVVAVVKADDVDYKELKLLIELGTEIRRICKRIEQEKFGKSLKLAGSGEKRAPFDGDIEISRAGEDGLVVVSKDVGQVLPGKSIDFDEPGELEEEDQMSAIEYFNKRYPEPRKRRETERDRTLEDLQAGEPDGDLPWS